MKNAEQQKKHFLDHFDFGIFRTQKNFSMFIQRPKTNCPIAYHDKFSLNSKLISKNYFYRGFSNQLDYCYFGLHLCCHLNWFGQVHYLNLTFSPLAYEFSILIWHFSGWNYCSMKINLINCSCNFYN